ncbi:radical SAM family heme chaperone HemW [Thiolapillus brandeum]|uniref:Heme chaperone HemW n=1 Tax=Thiolapillus brandeum TaxID=1076588 RepID=A0A7U6JGS6_9GAMM|nr:radical SAM family heme chaperone HemW [Thiolapillus brandeum]BAO43103.1 oxygen-independent coproporphyrinogen III oxidase [Thiolapillus brandeum]
MTGPLPGDVPLSLYVHIPWCLRKCPYCDFNSHALKGDLPEAAYVQALLADVDADARKLSGREVQTVFIGGGTPSLFSGEAIGNLLAGIRSRLSLAEDAEITLEANPGAVDAGHFAAYREAGVNRLSIGVQSFSATKLEALGRVHDPRQAREAFHVARRAGFGNINLDLMFGLPDQCLDEVLEDLSQALALAPEHLSWYQLTLEPNTLFHHQPPAVPGDGVLWEMQQAGQALLAQQGYVQYEVSGYARKGFQCRHNLNYWRFGDYLGAGAGAHGKLTGDGAVRRYWRERQPQAYMEAGGAVVAAEHELDESDRRLEFMMNALRLKQGVPLSLYGDMTGLSPDGLRAALSRARTRGLLTEAGDRLQATSLGQRFLNDLLVMFHE